MPQYYWVTITVTGRVPRVRQVTSRFATAGVRPPRLNLPTQSVRMLPLGWKRGPLRRMCPKTHIPILGSVDGSVFGAPSGPEDNGRGTAKFRKPFSYDFLAPSALAGHLLLQRARHHYFVAYRFWTHSTSPTDPTY